MLCVITNFFYLIFGKTNRLWLFLRFLLGFLIVSVNIYECQILIVFSLQMHHTCAAGVRLLAKNADYASPYLVMPSNSFFIDNILNKTGSSHVLNEEETEPSVQPSQPTAQPLSLAVS